MHAVAPPPLLPADATPATLTSVTERLCCPICLVLLDRPLELSCGAVVCLDCCSKWLQTSRSFSCPCCYGHSLSCTTVQPPSPLITSLVESLLINCWKGCGKVVRVDQYQAHLAGNCNSHYQEVDHSLSIREVLDKPTTSPVTPTEMRAAEHIMRRIIDQDTSNTDSHGIVKVRTRGQVSS